ncbi:hypothetical protein ACFPRL_04725 [Pseudoclavibacter helvolus]
MGSDGPSTWEPTAPKCWTHRQFPRRRHLRPLSVEDRRRQRSQPTNAPSARSRNWALAARTTMVEELFSQRESWSCIKRRS